MAWKNIEDKRAYQRQYNKERRAWYHEHGLCAECGKEDARTMIGKYICFDCYERKYGHMPEVNIEPKKKRKRVRNPKHGIPRTEYVANRLCSICGSAPLLRVDAYVRNVMVIGVRQHGLVVKVRG